MHVFGLFVYPEGDIVARVVVSIPQVAQDGLKLFCVLDAEWG